MPFSVTNFETPPLGTASKINILILFSFFLKKSHLEKAESSPALLTTSEIVTSLSMSAFGGQTDMPDALRNVCF
jgi:hypothetical protein